MSGSSASIVKLFSNLATIIPNAPFLFTRRRISDATYRLNRNSETPV